MPNPTPNQLKKSGVRTKNLTLQDKIQIGLKEEHEKLKPIINTYKLEILKQASLTNVTFKHLCETTMTSEGNVANITRLLEKDGLIEVKKEFVGKYPQTSYRATKEGIEVLVELKRFIDTVLSLAILGRKTQ